MGLSLSDLAGCRSAITGLLPDAVALYQNDGTTELWAGPARLDNDRSLTSRRDASDFVGLVTPQGCPVASGHVVQHTRDGLWYVVVKTSVDTAYTLEEQTMLLALPYTLTVKRPSAAQKSSQRSAWGSPAGSTATSATVSGTATTLTIHAGLANSFNPIDESAEGPQPRTAIYTAIAPLGSGVQQGDQVTLPDGRPARIDKLNPLYANETAYALQMLLNTSGGSGLA